MILTTCTIPWEFFGHAVDKEGTNYCGLTLNWNYQLGYVETSIHNYTPKSLKRLNYKKSKHPQHSPHKHVLIICDNKGYRQLINPYKHKELPPSSTKQMQSKDGSFLCDARDLKSTMLVSLNYTCTIQSNPK